MTNRRWLRIGVVLSVVGIAIGVALTQFFPHRYGGGTIRIRTWLVVLSSAIAVPSMLGAACIAKAAKAWPARALFGAAALAWCAQTAVMWALVGQPLDATGAWVTLLTVLVCLPSLLRALALFTSHSGRMFAVIDLIIVIVFWTQTPVEVMARAHVAQIAWWAVIPGVLALATLASNSDA